MLRDTLQHDQMTALKSGQKSRLEVLRFILAQIKNKEIEKKAPLTDEETVIVLQKFVKELKESIAAFEKGGRTDLVAQNTEQLEIVAPYLPKELADDELEAEIKSIMAANETLTKTNANAIIGICMKELRTRADSARIMSAIRKIQDSRS